MGRKKSVYEAFAPYGFWLDERGVHVIGVDYGAAEGDWSAEFEGVRRADGSITITDIRQWKRTIDA